jgi:hypothetical protein
MTRYCVYVNYPMSASVDEALLATDAKKFGGKEFGSGAGFGQRDLDYGNFTDEDQAEAFALHARGVHEDADAWVEFQDFHDIEVD